MASLKKMKDLNKKVNDAKQQFVDQAEQLIISAFKEEVFDKFPNVEAIRLVGYIPYFNDGDACTYSLGEASLQFEELEGFFDSYGYTTDGEDVDESELNAIENKTKAFEAADSVCAGFDEDIFESVFGSNNETIFHRDGTVTNESYGQHD